MCVDTIGSEQLSVRAAFGDAPMFHDEDLVCLLNGAEAVSDDETVR